MERQQALASRRDIPREDRLELIAEARGGIHMIDLILTGGLDETILKLLDMPEEIPKPPEDYMPNEWLPEETVQ